MTSTKIRGRGSDMYLLMMSLLLCRRRGEGVRKLAKSCRRHLWMAPILTFSHVLFLCWVLSYSETPHTWGPLIPGDPSYLGTPHTWGPLFPGDPSYLWAHHNWGSLVLFFSSGDSCFFSHISHANWNIY